MLQATDNESATDFNPVTAEIAIARALDELCARRSNEAPNRARIEELRREISRLQESIDSENWRLRFTEQRIAERRAELLREAERRRRPVTAEKVSLEQRRARAESELSAVLGRARSLETEKLTLEGKVKDLRDQARHMEEVVGARNEQLTRVAEACPSVLEEYRKLVGRSGALQSSLFNVVRQRVSLERERREHAKQEARLASENAWLREQLEVALVALMSTCEVDGSTVKGEDNGDPEKDRWYQSLMDKLNRDLVSCQRDLEALKLASGCADTDDATAQTTPDVTDA
ncbi:hypothetical protein V5799_003213 [Amblyomma americanum]|uniref:Uncharacterized protein n=1 Tax=Amblyomma americanum TaxID=6943 RepID=A0AAQ4D9L7_AMBAM